MSLFLLLAMLIGFLPAHAVADSPVTVESLQCEYNKNPVAVQSLRPRLSWILASRTPDQGQSAYQVLVASSLDRLKRSEPDMWNSGQVKSDQSTQIEYGGKQLQSGAKYYWKVRVWDKQGRPSRYSALGYWEMGLLSQKDWQAGWIGFPAGWDGQALYFHYGFVLNKPILSARIYISGIGYYVLHINGRPIGDHVLDPGATTYNKHVLYATYDVAEDLQHGNNAIGVIVGNGWYGMPKLLLQLNVVFTDHTRKSFFTSGSRGTPGTGGWLVTGSPVLSDSIYDGEVYDARLEKKDWDKAVDVMAIPRKRTEGWFYAVPVAPPGGVLVSQEMPAIQVVKTLRPVAMTEPRPGVFVFDAGRNLAGWACLHVDGPRGTRVTLRFAETLKPDGLIDQRNLRTAAATDVYILSGHGVETWHPEFTYHGYRYVQVEGWPGKPSLYSLQNDVIRSALPRAGTLVTSDRLINQIQQMVRRTEASNLYSIPTDCPQRDERMGWLNDLTARLQESLDNFWGPLFYANFANDIEDTQDQSGAYADTAPWGYGSRPADPVDESYMLVGWLLYEQYGDTRVMRQHYNSYRAWVDYLRSRAPNDLLSYGYYGDWSPPAAFSLPGGSAESKFTPRLFMSEGFYYYAVRLLSQMAGVLGKVDDEMYYQQLALTIRHALNENYWHNGESGYAANNQAADSFGIYLDTVPSGSMDRIVANLARDVQDHKWHLTTGNLCTKYLLIALSSHGHVDTAFRIATQDTYPSWGYMLANGATTLWERWEKLDGPGMNSHNHPMFGSVSSWFYKYLAGISSDPTGPGFKRSIIHPYVVPGLSWVKATERTMYGSLGVDWSKHKSKFQLNVSVPVNTSATVFVPTSSRAQVLVQGQPAQYEQDVRFLRTEDGCQVFAVPSGTYEFTSHVSVGN